MLNNIETYNYTLPEELIAQHPAEKRDCSRLLFADRHGSALQDMVFSDLLDLLTEDCFLVMNNTKVVPARLSAKKATGGSSEVFFLDTIDAHTFKALLRGRFKAGSPVHVGDLVLTARERGDDGSWIITSPVRVSDLLDRYGTIPLPPYINRNADAVDRERYQTVYASHGASVAAPTAGLHFTDELLKALADRGVEAVQLTLDVGIGTFRPVKTATLDEHEMHHESYHVGEEAAERINTLKRAGKKLIAVGTTSVRTLESAADAKGIIRAGAGNTNLFIRPGYEFKAVGGLITNFHLPKSSLLVLVAAFMGVQNALNAYKYAVENRYRFFSYGDAMVIL